MMNQFPIPDFLRKLGLDSAENLAWLTLLPDLIQKAVERWDLSLGEPYTENASCSYVAPCLMEGSKPAVLKIGLPHAEALHEIEGLQLLNGEPTVYLLDFDRESNTMLLEQCLPGTPLNTEPEPTQDEIIANLLPRIWQTPVPAGTFRPLAEMVALDNRETLASLPLFLDPELARMGCALKMRLIESSPAPVLLATDLHAGNVLRAQRQDWLVIDIKPYLGDPAFDLTQHLLNCLDRVTRDADHTLQRVANLGGVNPIRLRNWLFARLAVSRNRDKQALATQLGRN